MQIKYYETAWRDISNSPGWFGKLCLLALVNFIPVFGQIVTFGYLYGWAREIAWGVHAPMPAKLFSNDDGKFWRRGWFALVITVVFSILPGIVIAIGSGLQGAGMVALNERGAQAVTAMAGAGSLLYYVGIVFGWFMSILAWIGCMRSSIYNRLSAGFQLGKIWKMFRRDTGGILRVFGMELIVGLILGIILGILISILMFVFIFVGAAGLASAGYTASSFTNMTADQATQALITFIAASGPVGFLCLIVGSFAMFMTTSFIYMLVFRAVGHWTRQFDVPRWRGKDDPMPFENEPQPQPTSQTQPPLYYGGSFGQAGDPSQVQGQYQNQPGQELAFQSQPIQSQQGYAPSGSAVPDQGQGAAMPETPAQPVEQPASPAPEPFAGSTVAPVAVAPAEEPAAPLAGFATEQPTEPSFDPFAGQPVEQPASPAPEPAPEPFAGFPTEPVSPNPEPTLPGTEATGGIDPAQPGASQPND